ncbi:DUF6461 domain-containing protein [Streptosporangium sp. NPDC020145]|uniref:DUF6461 domain-containing protein n=1 Tax=Streptosporangium sp. NPDC020145 TaxID=3154694 RepID=UPI00344079EC
MIATPDDHSWFSQRFPDLADAYCFTYVHGLTPEELMARLGARVENCSHTTLDELIRWRSFGAASVGDWVLLVEANSGLGVRSGRVCRTATGKRQG